MGCPTKGGFKTRGEKMEYEQALIIGKRRRADAAVALGGYVREGPRISVP